jgi:hypothetical protein
MTTHSSRIPPDVHTATSLVLKTSACRISNIIRKTWEVESRALPACMNCMRAPSDRRSMRVHARACADNAKNAQDCMSRHPQLNVYGLYTHLVISVQYTAKLMRKPQRI